MEHSSNLFSHCRFLNIFLFLSSIRCKRVSYTCRQGDTECLNAPISLSYNFLTFPLNVKIPTDLFSMSGPSNTRKRFDWVLRVVNARPTQAGVQPINGAYFDLKIGQSEAVVSLINPIPGPQDVELELNMEITDPNTGYSGKAVSFIYLYVTSDEVLA